MAPSLILFPRAIPGTGAPQQEPLPQAIFSGDPDTLISPTSSSSWAGSGAREQDAVVPGRISAHLAQAQGAVVSPLPCC